MGFGLGSRDEGREEEEERGEKKRPEMPIKVIIANRIVLLVTPDKSKHNSIRRSD